MIHFTKPTQQTLAKFLSSKQNAAFSYADVGATRGGYCPEGFILDHNRVLLGHGAPVYEKAKSALLHWRMFDMDWLTLRSHETPLCEGELIAVAVRVMGLWFLNVNRIVYAFDESEGGTRRFGFAYGTTTEHYECGEERFAVISNNSDGSVHYEITAFSRPNSPLVRATYPFARRLQRRFVRDSLTSIKTFCEIER